MLTAKNCAWMIILPRLPATRTLLLNCAGRGAGGPKCTRAVTQNVPTSRLKPLHHVPVYPKMQMVGLLLIMASAFFFALATVRLGRYSMLFDSLKLSTASACSLSVVSVVWVLCSSLGRWPAPFFIH
eukprot:1160390-Pelagomonas_calceolata.AAC.10